MLLFVSADSGTYYHQKYMYNGVYRTRQGIWAGVYADDDYGHANNRNTRVKPVRIEFANEVSFPATVTGPDSQVVKLQYREPYFRISGDKAVAVWGNYVNELFILKRDGYLTARELFKDGRLR